MAQASQQSSKRSIANDDVPTRHFGFPALCARGLLEEVLIDLDDMDRALDLNAHPVAHHQARKAIAVDEHYAGGDLVCERLCLKAELAGGDEDALVGLVSRECAHESLNRRAADDVIGCVPLGLDVDAAQPEGVLVDGTAARSGDRLGLCSLSCGSGHDGLVLDRGQSAECVLAASVVVGPFDPGHDRDPELLAGVPAAAVENVLLQ